MQLTANRLSMRLWMSSDCSLRCGDLLDAPAEVELGIRFSGAADYLFLLNYSDKPAVIRLKKAVKDLLSGALLEEEVEMPQYGVLILETGE
ncbi:Beta-galactosidase C-terminal domain [Paenibacillus sp. P25]|nr:Beta-galactosidase C-terminal domain [Paenibacillus sp. P25]